MKYIVSEWLFRPKWESRGEGKRDIGQICYSGIKGQVRKLWRLNVWDYFVIIRLILRLSNLY